MAFEQKEMQGLIIAFPDKARAKIIAALKKNGVHMGKASKALACSHVTLLRWIVKLGLEKEVEKMKKEAIKAGTYAGIGTGRPRGTTVANGAAPRGSKVSATG